MKPVVLLSLLLLTGCATKMPIKVWRFKTCAPNGEIIVCQCEHFHVELNAKAAGEQVGVCE